MYEDVKLETSFSLFSVGFRGEYQILPNRYLPYLSVDFLANYFNEPKIELGFDYVPHELDPDYWWQSTYLYSTGMRFGAGLGIGYNFYFLSRFVIDVHTNYAIFNLFGKKGKKNLLGESSIEEKLDAINLSISILYYL